MRSQMMPFACAALALTVATTSARADDGRGDRPISPSAFGDGDEAACDLVTRGEAARTLGAPVAAGIEKSFTLPLKGAGALRAQYCLYGSDLIMGRVALGTAGRATFGRYRKSLAGTAGFHEVTGIGDEAFTARGQLNVRRGNTTIIIDVGQSRAVPDDLAAERVLAAMAIPRL